MRERGRVRGRIRVRVRERLGKGNQSVPFSAENIKGERDQINVST